MAMYHQSRVASQVKRHRPNTHHLPRSNAAYAGQDLFGLLPDDCTQVIFSFLPSARDRCACAAVSKRWLVLLAHMRGCEFNPFRFAKKYSTKESAAVNQKIADDADEEASRCLEAKEANDARLAAMAVGTYARKLLGNLSVRAGTFPSLSQQRITDFGLHIVSRSFPNLKSLSLWDCFKVGSTGLASIARCCRALEKLDISNSPRIDDNGLVPIAKNCPNLSTLSLESCPLVGNRSLLALAKCSSHLQSITIARCPQVTDEGVISVVSHLPNLTRIRLAQLKLGDATLEAIGKHKGSIKLLALESITGLTASGFAWVSLATRLESLRLHSCVADAGICGAWDRLMPTFKVLKHVSIKNCNFLNDEILISITNSTRNLESLKLDRCDWVTTDGLMGAMKNCSRTLKILHLVKCNAIGTREQSEGDEENSSSYPLLHSLTLKNCVGIDDRFLSTMAPVCANVMHIGLVGLTSITDHGLFSLLRSMRPTTSGVRVNLNGCGKITDWSVLALARAFGDRLESLSLEGCSEVSDRSLAVIGELCSGLTELDMSRSRVTDVGLVRLVTTEHQKLEVISVAGCEGVTDTGLSCLEVMCGRLVGLNVQHCGGVSRRGVESFRATLWWCDVLY